MNRIMRMRKYNPSSNIFDVLFPQTITGNVLRKDGGGVLENDLLQYDHHLQNDGVHINHAVSGGTYRDLTVRIPDAVLTDGFPLLLTLHCDLECEPTLSFNGSDPAYIVSGDGDNIPGGQAEGTVMFLVWSEPIKKWILMSSDTFSDITKVYLPMETEYVYTAPGNGITTIVIPEFDKNSDKLVVNYGQTILRPGIDYTFPRNTNNTVELVEFSLDAGDVLQFLITKYVATAKRGSFKYDLVTEDHAYTAEHDGVGVIPVPEEVQDASSVMVNYGQTILRNNLDYTYNEDHTQISLINIQLNQGEVITFHATKFVESNAEILPNNWGATGNYRYSMNVIHTSYVATADDVTVIPVPGYNYKRDDIWPIMDNKLLIWDVDYTIDEIGQVVLLKTALKRGDEIFFTILQGAMFDVPNFNVIRATGESGQHILLDMSYSVLTDFYTILVLLKYDLETNPTIKTIDGPAESICDCYGNPVLGGYKAGSYLWLVYNRERHMWYSLGHGQMDITSMMPSYLTRTGTANFLGQDPDRPGEYLEAVIPHGLSTAPSKIDIQPCEPPGVDVDGEPCTIGDIWSYADETNLHVGNSGNAVSMFKWTVSTEDSTADLRTYIDQQIAEVRAQPSNFETKLIVFTAEADNTTEIPLDDFKPGVDKLIVNYGQTLLREGIDYELSGNIVTLTNFALNIGDIIQFTIIVQTA